MEEKTPGQLHHEYMKKTNEEMIDIIAGNIESGAEFYRKTGGTCDKYLTIRDHFAGLAMQGLISGCYAGTNVGFTVQGNVVAAYEYADAMLAARGES